MIFGLVRLWLSATGNNYMSISIIFFCMIRKLHNSFSANKYRICRSISRTVRPGFTSAFRRVRLILRIFHKPKKLVGVVKYTDCMVVKWESDDQAIELYRRF